VADKKEEAKAPITDVKFVKHPEWRTGMVTADVDTGFQVGGGAIVPVPDAETHPDAHASAVRLLRSGLIEPASQAEWDEHQETNAPDHAVREAIRDELVQQQAVPAGAYAFARHPVAGGLATPTAEVRPPNQLQPGEGQGEDWDADEDRVGVPDISHPADEQRQASTHANQEDPDHVRRQALAAKRRAKKSAGASGKESGGKESGGKVS